MENTQGEQSNRRRGGVRRTGSVMPSENIQNVSNIPEGQILNEREIRVEAAPGVEMVTETDVMVETEGLKKERVAVRWEGVEYVAREKNTWWYLGLVVVSMALVVLSVVLGWWTFTAVVVLAAVALVLYTVRPPRKIKYVLSNRGLKEGERLYAFGDFKAFGVEAVEGHYAIVLMPRKRFSPRVRVYFPEEMGEVIVDAFGARLPMEEVKDDMLDKIVRWLRI